MILIKMAGEITDLINYLNQSKGIPLLVEQTTTTNSWQFTISIVIALIGSFFILFMFGATIKSGLLGSFNNFRLNILSKKLGRNVLMIKHTERSLFNSSMINNKTFLKIIEALDSFKGKPFDLILHTPGGTIFDSQLISRLIHNYPGEVRAIIPQYSMSGGTLLALSADSIYMSENSCLGPVDPQLGNLWSVGSARSWNEILRIKGKKAEDSSINFAIMGKQYTKSINKVIKNILSDDINERDKEKISRFFTSGQIEHGYNILFQDLLKLKLDVKLIESKDILTSMNKIISSESLEGVHHIKI